MGITRLPAIYESVTVATLSRTLYRWGQRSDQRGLT